MGYSTRVEVGNPIRLNLQLSNGEDELPKIVKSYLRDSYGNPLDEIDLIHVGQGLFKNYQYLMPENTPEITAQYRVFNIDETPDTNYITDFDIFEPEVISDSDSGSSYVPDDGLEVFFDIEDNNYIVDYEDHEVENEVIVIEALVCNTDTEEINVIIEDDEIWKQDVNY